MKEVTRTEQHIISKKHKYFSLLDNFCFMSKNLYNFANYRIRQSFCKEDGKYISYNELDKILKQEGSDFDYRNMPSAQSAQQTLMLLDKNWNSFFKSIADWKDNKAKYKGRPRIPKYLLKNGRNVVILTVQNCKFRDGIVRFPKSFNGLTIQTKMKGKLQQVRIVPKNQYIVVEVVYKIKIADLKGDNGRYMSIDLGIDNFTTITNNFKEMPIVINGKGLKSMNQYSNKKIAHYQSISKQMNNLHYTNRLYKIMNKRNRKIHDFMHKSSREVINVALESDVKTIIIGINKNWKNEVKMGKINNQKFVGIPFDSFIRKVVYKAENEGIRVILTEESYTSGTSFLDNESPIKTNYDISRRKSRGMFVGNNKKINADVNASYQIMKKVFPNAFSNGIESVGLHPFVVDVMKVASNKEQFY